MPQANLFGIRKGHDITGITTENIVSAVPTPEGMLITFHVHGAEGTRTYLFEQTLPQFLGAGIDLSEFIAAAELL